MEMTFDCFTYNGEEDILELRLAILDKHVDYFVLGESYQTFSGRFKPLYYEENQGKFKKWNHKIIHIVSHEISTTDPFTRAHYQKESLKIALDKCNDNDVIYFGDVDEIWKPQEVGDKVYNLHQLNYSYYLNNRSSEKWVGTIVGRWGKVKTNTFTHWRANHVYELDDGGWHFTNMGGIEKMRYKLASYDHAFEVDTPYVTDNLEYRFAQGQDYLGRSYDWQGKPFTMWTDASDLPKHILRRKRELMTKGLWK